MPHLNKNVVGYVPAKMTYVQRAPSEVSDYWEHDFWGDEKPPTRTVRETFVVDADNPNTRKTATEWAGPHAVFTDKTNDPIEEVEVVSLVLRGNGGRAWKVLIDGTFYVDLREDVMLDALRHGMGVKKGMLKGPFQWAGVAGQNHLESRRIATIRGRKQAPSRPPPQHLKRTNARGPRTTGVVVGVMVRAGRADIVL